MAKPPAPARIVYQDSKGETTERVVTFTATSRSGGEIYLEGFCHLKNQRRSFCASRILSMVDLATGETVGDPIEWAFAYRSRQEESTASEPIGTLSVNLAAELPPGKAPIAPKSSSPAPKSGSFVGMAAIAVVVFIALATCIASSSKPSAPPPPAPTLSSEDKDKARAVLQDLVRKGAIDKHEMGASGMARIWAGPKWEGLTFEQKTTFCAAVLAVHDAHGLRVISRSGKDIGSYDKTLGYQAE